MKENINNTGVLSDTDKKDIQTSNSTYISSETQETPVDLQRRGEGSGQPSVCQKL